ncbi:MAG: TIGR00268 family protein [Odoribacter sp.]|nr:TIGR00268 family protein [Odoribacter sp.]
MLNKKLENLDTILKNLKSFVIAFSGGVDSTFLLHRASQIKRLKIAAVTIRTSYIPKSEIDEAVEFCETNNINHTILDLSCPEEIRNNPSDRCYLCKKLLFGNIKSFAEKHNYNFVIDGSNADDNGDFRPGLKALAELGIRSPLMESGLIKHEVRELSHKAELPTWDKPANACLLTRIPYDTKVTENDLRMVEKAEQFLFEKGFPGTRVRKHGEIARIECLPGYIHKIIIEPEKSRIIENLKNIGFRYISLDLEGYRTGSLNPETKKHDN